jgi:outer membrane assembly lipoprotein YfiO
MSGRTAPAPRGGEAGGRLAAGARALLAAAMMTAVGCASGGDIDLSQLASSSDQVIWEAGQKAMEKKQYDAARQYFRRIIDGFPQSEYGPAARLAIGDSFIKEGGTGNYLQAVAAHREFLTVYPSHPRSDYAQFQVAEAYFRQRNGPDRDQTDTKYALEEYERLLDLYPATTHAETARERIRQLRQSLARAEFMAGYFYQRTREACRSAIPRYEGILADYPDYERLDEVLYRLGECMLTVGRAGEAIPHLARIPLEYPQSEYAKDARGLHAEASALPGAAPLPSPPPAPEAPADGSAAPSNEPGPAPSPSPSP